MITDEQRYCPFSSTDLIVGARIPFDVYIQSKGIYHLLFDSGTDYTDITRDFLARRDLNTLYVVEKDRGSLESYRLKGFTESVSIYGSPEAFTDYVARKDRYFQIDRNMLIPGTRVDFSLYLMDNYNYTLALHADAGSPATIDNALLSSKGDFIIMRSDVPRYNDYIGSLLKSGPPDEGDTSKLKALIIRENSKIVLRDLFDNPRSGEKIRQTQLMVANMVDSIMKDSDAVYDLLSIRGYDYYTYTHSVNVCVLSVGMGSALNLSKSRTERLGIGAMLHDIGKSAIPVDIVNKQGKLNDSEYIIIKSHVAEGERILKGNHYLPDDSLSAVTQHHEKMNGKGYPAGLTGEDITLFGRITAIADCYDAMTTTRPYRVSMTPFCALNTIATETGNYDPAVLKVFIAMLGKIG
jgi:HD-GYP domain-containing protein (c-di-GMP phosphodiesterase class II)